MIEKPIDVQLQEALAETRAEEQRRANGFQALFGILGAGLPVYGVGPGPKPPGHKAKMIVTLKKVSGGPAPAAESTITNCQRCHTACWISPKAREALGSLPGARTLCVECTVKECEGT